METAKAIFPLCPGRGKLYWHTTQKRDGTSVVKLTRDKLINEYGRIAGTFFKSLLYKPESECGRQIVAAYKADKKKNPTPTSQSRQSSVSNAASMNETEEA